jgi:hypothetical protein
MSNSFRITPDKSLDREYLRVCAVHRCIKRYGVDRRTANELASRKIRGIYKKEGWLAANIDLVFRTMQERP